MELYEVACIDTHKRFLLLARHFISLQLSPAALVYVFVCLVDLSRIGDGEHARCQNAKTGNSTSCAERCLFRRFELQCRSIVLTKFPTWLRAKYTHLYARRNQCDPTFDFSVVQII